MKDRIKSSGNKWILVAIGSVLISATACLVLYSLRVLNHDLNLSSVNNRPPADRLVPETKLNVRDDLGVPSTPRHSPSEMPSDEMKYAEQGALDEEGSLSEIITETVLEPPQDGGEANQDVQSLARPFGLDIIAPVQIESSDKLSVGFADNVLPGVLEYIESNVVHSTSIELISTEAEPSNLILKNPANVRVYFVGEEAAYHNSIGLNLAAPAENEFASMLVFPDASTPYSYFPEKDTEREHTSEECPLVPGDFVDIGAVEAGSVLDFFIIPRGASEASGAYGVDKTLNEDLVSHVRILAVVEDSMILLGFEDRMYGGDQDFDDVMIAVEIGENNLQSISASLGL